MRLFLCLFFVFSFDVSGVESLINQCATLKVYEYREDILHETGGGTAVFMGGPHLVTCYHVIDEADAIMVKSGSKEYVVVVLKVDKKNDLALLYSPIIDSKGLTIGEPKIGMEVYSVGNSYSIGLHISKGIVSYIGKSIHSDTTIVPGNSGGGLFTKDGKLVGISSSMLSHTGHFTGVGVSVHPKHIKELISPYVTSDAE